MNEEPTRCGFVAIIGAPNAGKSTLINCLAGYKLAIVSHKVQTTRSRIRAIVIDGQSQIIFVDTPGIFPPRRRLDEAMVEAAWGGAGEADIVLLIVDVRAGISEDVARILQKLAEDKARAVLVLNKIDLVRREKLLDLSARLNEVVPFEETFMVSARTGDGVDVVRRRLAHMMPVGPWLYPADQVADVPMRFIASEITREKIYERLHQELPYASTVETESWKENRDGSVRIEQVIFVERESQRKIVLGKGGQSIREIGRLAREELSSLLERKVHLFLFVKVRENWASDPERLRAMGLEP
ncbi:MAG TPA: GTPase Era [Aestuariivirgaceae bacterium]